MIEWIPVIISIVTLLVVIKNIYAIDKTSKTLNIGMQEIYNAKEKLNALDSRIISNEQKFLAELKKYVLAPEEAKVEEPKKEETLMVSN